MRTVSNDQQARADDARRDFATHVVIFSGIGVLLAIIDAFSEGGPWFHWPMLGWGFALVLHALRVYVEPHLAVEDAEARALALELGEQPHGHA